MGFNDEGLGAAMAESYLRDRADAQTNVEAMREPTEAMVKADGNY